MQTTPLIGRRGFMAYALALATAPVAQAASWPTRSVTLVVPYAAGGNTDNMARVAAEALGKLTGQPFIVENKGGAGGTIGADYVAKAKPDGYTLFFGTVSQMSTAPFTNKIKYDPLKDFVPISNVGGNPFVIAARSDAPFKTLPELVAYGKANPSKLTAGHAGVGGLTHLSAAMFLLRVGVDAVMVPYRGAAPALTDVLAGQTDFYSGNLSEVLPYAGSGKLRLLGVSSPQRNPSLPDVPAITEFYPHHVVETWNGILGPRGMPAAAVDVLEQAMRKVHADAAFKSKLQAMGITPIAEIGQRFGARITQDTAKWKPVIEAAGIKPE